MSPFLVLFLVVDAVITIGVLLFLIRRHQANSVTTVTTTTTTTTPTASAPGTAPSTSTTRVISTTTAAAPFGSPRSVSTPGATASGSTPDATPETGSLTRLFGRGQLRGLATFAAEQNERIRDYVRDNWSGVPDQLPAVLSALLTDLEHDAEAKGLWLDRETLKSMLAVALRSQRLGGGGRRARGAGESRGDEFEPAINARWPTRALSV